MKVLFIGGTGLISSACSALAVEHGIELHLLNRGTSQRPGADGAHVIHADIRDSAAATQALAGQTFDVVADFVAYTAEHVQADIDLFNGRTGQYIFISSASAYQKPPATLPFTESTPLTNPFWKYSRDKIAGENVLLQAYRDIGFPATIVRPSHTYDQRSVPLHGGYTMLERMRQGKKIVIHGDGSSLWTLTNHRDLAKAFIGLLGNVHAIGEAFHITSDEVLSWNQIANIYGQALGVEPHIVHIPSDLISAYDPQWALGIVGDKMHCLVFDNSKIKRFVPGWVATIPFTQGARETVAWYNADPARRVIDPKVDALVERMLAGYEAAWPK